jgi:AcrR family transcriptional regulator
MFLAELMSHPFPLATVYAVHPLLEDRCTPYTLSSRNSRRERRRDVPDKVQQVAAPSQRVRLSRERVVRTAVALADQVGIEQVSMRRLAQGLGVVPMALYKHVAHKEQLLGGMVDVVFDEVPFTSGAGWRRAMRERAISMREALLRHPWAIGLMESRAPGPANLRHHNAVMGCLRVEAGLPFRMAVHAYSVMDGYIYGFALQERSLPMDIPAEAESRLQRIEAEHPSPADEYPYLIEVVMELGKSGYDSTDEFEFGLDLILDGIERLRRGDRETPARRPSKKR